MKKVNISEQKCIIGDESLELIANKVCSHTEKCCECLLSDGKMCKGTVGITKNIIEMVQKWENNTDI